MRKPSSAMLIMTLVALGIAGTSSARAQEQTAQPAAAQAPERALSNLHQAAQSMINDPGAEYDKTASPDFPYPSEVWAQWNASMLAYGTQLTEQQRALFAPCADHLNNAIDYMERGYRETINQPDDSGAQADATKLKTDAQAEFNQCDAAYALAQSEVVNASGNQPQQGGAGAVAQANGAISGTAAADDTNGATPAGGANGGGAETPTSDTNGSNGAPIDGSVEEAALPGSIDWTPALDPLFQYLSRKWQKVTTDPKNSGWAPNAEGNSLTLKLQPNQQPEMVSSSGARKSSLEDIMQNGDIPKTQFPSGTRLSYVTVTPKFQEGLQHQPGRTRTRLKYYERGGIFKSYPVAQ